MERIYKIGDKLIKFNIPFEFEGEEYIDLFKVDLNNDEYVDMEYKIIYKDNLNLNDKKKICDFIDLRVYEDDNGLIWEFVDVNTNEVYSYLIDYDESEKLIYISNKSENVFSKIGDIFRRINIHGSLLKKNVMILHSNYIIHNDEAILFTAPSGTGKSTQGDLWKKYKGAEVINGDRSVIGIKDKEYFAYGFPFSGSSNICLNKEAKIKAVVVIEQAKENTVRKLGKVEAFKMLLKEVAINRWNKKEMNIAMELVEKLINNVPILMLSCRPDKKATDVLHEALLKL